MGYVFYFGMHSWNHGNPCDRNLHCQVGHSHHTCDRNLHHTCPHVEGFSEDLVLAQDVSTILASMAEMRSHLASLELECAEQKRLVSAFDAQQQELMELMMT